MIEPWQLRQKQSIPLEGKIRLSEVRIRQWYERWNGEVCIAFSGGKDSTVLLHLVRSLYPNVPAVFVDTGLEFPEIREFVKNIENVVWLKPELSFLETIEKYGYPVVSKVTAFTLRKLITQNLSDRYRNKLLHGDERGNTGKLAEKWKFLLNAPFKISGQCCEVMKKRPVVKYYKKSGRAQFTGVMASDSDQRKRTYLRYGCNSFDLKLPNSTPLSFWVENDIWDYIKKYKLSYSKIYDMGYDRTGCMFCMFGVHMEKGKNRFQLMYKTHPKQWKYCMDKLGLREVLKFIDIPIK